MERLWAPWRNDYLINPKRDVCIFCEQGSDRDLLILQRTSLTHIMLNRYPYANGHLLVSPERHTADLDSLTDGELLELLRGAALCRRLLARASAPDGFNLGMNLGKAGGAGVEDHLHLHVVPRWNGDNNFMGVIADCRVLPEALLATYDRLLPLFAETGELD